MIVFLVTTLCIIIWIAIGVATAALVLIKSHWVFKDKKKRGYIHDFKDDDLVVTFLFAGAFGPVGTGCVIAFAIFDRLLIPALIKSVQWLRRVSTN